MMLLPLMLQEEWLFPVVVVAEKTRKGRQVIRARFVIQESSGCVWLLSLVLQINRDGNLGFTTQEKLLEM